MRANALKDMEAPKVTTSKTDKEEPSRDIPNKDNADPIRAKLRTAKADPK
jgi:hypothetical protein